MLPCQRFAFFTLARDAMFVALAGATMMVAASFAPALAFKIGASVALAYCLLLLVRAKRLTGDRFRRSEVWRALTPDERPQGEHGFEVARAATNELMLHFAKGAAAVAGILYSSALLVAANAIAHAGM